MKRIGLVFARIENFKKIKYPVFLKNILIETAFDTAAALKAIKQSTIENIEQFVSNRLDLLANTNYIDETGNLRKTPFKFLPGHEALILSLPNYVDDYLCKKKKDIPAIEHLKLSLMEKIKEFAIKKIGNKYRECARISVCIYTNKQSSEVLCKM